MLRQERLILENIDLHYEPISRESHSPVIPVPRNEYALERPPSNVSRAVVVWGMLGVLSDAVRSNP